MLETGNIHHPAEEAVKGNFYRPSTYERAKRFGQSRYNWFSSKMKESGNIRNSWTKGNRENRKKILYYGKSYKERCS